MTGYHFTGATLRNGDPIPPIGEWLTYNGSITPCESGLHASEHSFDALQYAPGQMLHRVELDGDLVSHGFPVDKWVGRRRRILATIDATDVLRAFARRCALDVANLWDAQPVVRQYLETGNEQLRAAAGAAAVDAARDAARDASAAARAAARAAAGAAGVDAAWAAARAAVWAAAGAAAWDARDAQRARLGTMVDAAFGRCA